MSGRYDLVLVAGRGPIHVVLGDWNARWFMLGPSICCHGCYPSQDALYAAQAYVHEPGCTVSDAYVSVSLA